MKAMLKNMLKSKMNSRGAIGNLQPIVLTLTVVAIVLVVSFKILGQLQSSLTAGSTEYNATSTVIETLNTNVVGNLGLIILITVMALVIGLVSVFAARSR